MSKSVPIFVPRVFSKPTKEELAQMSRKLSVTNEDYDTRSRVLSLAFTAPATATASVAPVTSQKAVGSTIDRKGLLESGEDREAKGIRVVRHDVPDTHDLHDDLQGMAMKAEAPCLIPIPGDSSPSHGADLDNNSVPLTNLRSSDMSKTLSPGEDSDLEWDQPGAFDFLVNIETDNFETSDNDTRSSGYTELSPLRPRRLFETALLDRAARGCSSLRESALWSDTEDTTDLSSIADANDLSQYHADLEDELDGNDIDADESGDEYSSACSTLAASDESGDDDFFDARSDSEYFEVDVA